MAAIARRAEPRRGLPVGSGGQHELLAEDAGLRRTRDIWSPSATWIPATGPPTSPADRSSATRCSASSCISNLMAVLLQGLASKLGIVTGRDLAQACRDHYSTPVSFVLWILCEIAIAACDLAEVIGSAIALNLLFDIPLPIGVALTALDVLLLLYLQNKGFRVLEALVIALIATVGVCFVFEMILSRPDIGADAARLHSRPARSSPTASMLYIAIGILGATVMPHNLYLHSSIVQTRQYEETADGKREAVRFAFIDSTIALSFALFINAAILIVAAATFHTSGHIRGGRDPGRVQAAHAAARRRGEHRLRARPAGVGAELDADRHARRPDRHGGISQHPAPPLAAPAHHAPHRHRAGRHRRHLLRRQRDGAAAHPQPGHSQPAAFVRRLPARDVHLRQAEDGRVRRTRRGSR